jgi:hypothetical protein
MNTKHRANLAVVRNPDIDMDDQIELIQPIPDIDGINEPIYDVAIPMDVASTELYVDRAYQRDRSSDSTGRAVNMTRNWNWALFERPLIWTDAKDRKVVIDGQHTILAWVSHPDLPLMIPVNMLTGVHSERIAAEIFMGRNMNRTRLHHLQEFKAALVAEKDWAKDIWDLAQSTGVRIPFTPEFHSSPNTCMALRSLSVMIEKYGMPGAKRVLSILTEGALRPIRETHIKAISWLMFEPQFKGQFNVEKMKAVLRATNDNLILGKAIQDAVETKLTRWETLAGLYRKEYQRRFD